MAVAIPEKYLDLFEKPVAAALVTLMPDGQPQATPVWTLYDGTHVIINTARGRQKDKNMSVGAPVTVLLIDPENMYRWVEVRGKIVEEDEASGLDVINALSDKYRGNPDYYKGNEAMRGKETRVTYKIEPLRVNPQ